ncbi:hypothetical protein L218DRAFT_1010646 [Marasmius fiardii PR-910]|nr:hypothetical protein L218DRAFT_1010646 [Marasmius fiardii PR-910]
MFPNHAFHSETHFRREVLRSPVLDSSDKRLLQDFALASPQMQSVHMVDLRNACGLGSRRGGLRPSGGKPTETEERHLRALSRMKDKDSPLYHPNLRYVALRHSKREWRWLGSSTEGVGEWFVVQ